LEPPSHADRGRGLLVVAGLATLWGVAHHETRKMVWAEMDLREPISVGQAAD
jgi:hypothetical protein